MNLVLITRIERRHGAIEHFFRRLTISVNISPVVENVDQVQRPMNNDARMALNGRRPTLIVVDFMPVKRQGGEAKQADGGPAKVSRSD